MLRARAQKGGRAKGNCCAPVVGMAGDPAALCSPPPPPPRPCIFTNLSGSYPANTHIPTRASSQIQVAHVQQTLIPPHVHLHKSKWLMSSKHSYPCPCIFTNPSGSCPANTHTPTRASWDGENWLAPGGGHGCRLKEGGGGVWEMDICDRTYVWSSLSAFFLFF